MIDMSIGIMTTGRRNLSIDLDASRERRRR